MCTTCNVDYRDRPNAMTTCVSSKQSNETEKKKLRRYSGAGIVAGCVKIELHPLQEAFALRLGGEE